MKSDPGNRSSKLPYYKIPIREFFARIHRDVPATRFWGYDGTVPGPTIETRSGTGVLIEWPNELPLKHFLPIDHNLMGAEADKPAVRTVVHLHGAKASPENDGYPENWYQPGQTAIYHYPNRQDPAMLWYHDHAMGINRLNVCAGMAGVYILRDGVEEALNLPAGKYEIPLVFMDRMIREDGQLYYPVAERPDFAWVPEYFGDAVLVNGKLLPYLQVEPRKYRFRLLNASNGRFYFFSLSGGLSFRQIGTDQGLLNAPIEVGRLALAPGERADVVIDFSNHAGEQILLNNLALSPMQFRVLPSQSAADLSSVPAVLRPFSKTYETAAVRTRRLTLEEVDNAIAEPITHLLDGKRWHDPISEKPVLGSTEIWEFLNLTDDSHPIHLHLVRFQILDRRGIDVPAHIYDKKLTYTTPPVPPDPSESGWKDTVRVSPGSSTRIIVKFEGFAGRYVWHCHILEHEDNEMMRPFEVIAPG